MILFLVGGCVGLVITMITDYTVLNWQWYVMMIPAAIAIVAVNNLLKEG